MKEVIRTNDLILISRILSILDDEAVRYDLLDTHASIVEGSVNAIQKRIVVSNDDFQHCKNLIKDLTNVDESE